MVHIIDQASIIKLMWIISTSDSSFSLEQLKLQKYLNESHSLTINLRSRDIANQYLKWASQNSKTPSNYYKYTIKSTRRNRFQRPSLFKVVRELPYDEW